MGEIDQNTRQKISLQPRGGDLFGRVCWRPRPGSRARIDRSQIGITRLSAPIMSSAFSFAAAERSISMGSPASLCGSYEVARAPR